MTKYAVDAGVAALESGASGGGCVFEFDKEIPFWARCVHRIGVITGRALRITGGCFLFCRRETYEAVGGFPEKFLAGEDMALVRAIKSQGNFVIPGPLVYTSARKLKVVGLTEVLQLVLTILLRGENYQSKRTIDFIYGERTERCREVSKVK